jgi:plasmid stabilization system protein ParE
MNGKVIWSERSKNDYANILGYLTKKWTSKEIVRFTDTIESNITLLISYPEMATISKKKAIRKLVISKQISLYYKIIRDDIYIISLFDNRQNPKKLGSL